MISRGERVKENRTGLLIALAALAWWLFFRKPASPYEPKPEQFNYAGGANGPPPLQGNLDDAHLLPPGTPIEITGKPYAPAFGSNV